MNAKLGTINVPTPIEITKGRDPEQDAALGLARETAHNIHGECDRATGRLTAATARVDALKRDVPLGRAGTGDLERALAEQRSAALVLPGYQQRVIDADAAVGQALARANASVIKEAFRRRDELQAVADKVTPILSALIAAEDALDAIVIPLGAINGVAPVTWPESNFDRGAFRLARQLGASAPKVAP